jgi:hypothetical protein
MILNCYDINIFIDSIQNKPYDAVILLADKEATSAERAYLHNPSYFPPNKNYPVIYARQLKELITYLRYGVASPVLNRRQLNSLEKIRKARERAYFSAA